MSRIGKIALMGLGAAAVVAGLGYGALRFVPAVQDFAVERMIAQGMAIDRSALMADDALRVIVCGSGSPMPDPNRAPACYLVIAGGKTYLVDAGAGSFSRLVRWRIPVSGLSHVFLTHFHSDHIGDLGEANMQSWAGGRRTPLTIHGGPGIEQVVGGFNMAYAPDSSYRTAHHTEAYMPIAASVMQASLMANDDGTPFTGTQGRVVLTDGDLTVTAFAVDHAPIVPAYGYRFDYKGRSVVFSGDTVPTASITQFGAKADVLISEAMAMEVVEMMSRIAAENGNDGLSHLLGDTLDYHTSPQDAAAMADDAGIGHVVLSHLAPPMPQWIAEIMYTRNVASNADVHVAFDGMLIELPLGNSDVRFGEISR